MAFETISLGTQPAGTGGDTARTAFEKVNRNFLAADVLAAAMSQVKFEAIRDQNKERYAASGWVSLGNHESGKQVNECKPGLYTSLTTPNTLLIGKSGGVGGSKNDNAALNMAGVLFHLPVGFSVKFSNAPDGKTTYNKSTGVITNHATVAAAFNAQAADPTNVEVVTDRQDMWGFEAWLEEVSTTNPHIYPNGLPQSQATTMDGIATSASARPVTYYAVFDGDTGSKGKGLNFFALTDAQKKKVLANHKNNLYYLNDGRLVQWRLRQRTIAGAGNANWYNVDSNNQISSWNHLTFAPLANTIVRGQGSGNTVGSTQYYDALIHPNNTNPKLGVFTARTPTVISVNSECYFLACGTVNRLNQGAYHYSYNSSGSAAMAWITTPAGQVQWFSAALAKQATNVVDCFNTFSLGGSKTENTQAGAIGSIYPQARPDGHFHDAIYADGQGGVCRDMRYSAYGVDTVDFAEADQKVKNGTYRGFEKTKLATALSSVDSNVSVGGSFHVTEVIATNAVINVTAALSGGWSGFKNAQSPTGSISVFELSRDAVSTPTALRSTNNGVSWSAFTPTFNAANNSVTLTNEPAANIVILQYQAFAKQTESAPNAAVAGLVPHNVFASSDYRSENGALLGESLIGKVLKNNTGVSVNNKSLLSCAIDSSGELTSASNFDGVTHQSLTLGSPANNSPTFKAVSYLANINQQAVPHFAYTELRHNGTSFGDDGKQTIVDNQSTKTDLNGNTVLVGTAKLKEPIGWIKNKV
ncbi:hypothetical protein [Shewanella baltica]|uniref:hypothetical protein n=1 Tax=Shewanella baltica TaxID=62322 RepID=UPI000E01F2B7|nr:hypothetical protein [Shewanella baltica]SUI65235.1 Uncharacterised protein [Shewanella baltica]